MSLIIAGGVVALIVAIVVMFAASGGDDAADDTTDISFNGVQLPPFETPANDPAVGMKAPLFVTTDLTGEQHVVGGGGGPADTAKVILFAAHWCPTCQAEIPEVADYLNTTDLPEGVEFVTVSTFPNPSRDNYPPDAWFDSVDWPYPVMVDSGPGEIAQMFGMGGVPGWVVLDNQNFVLTRLTGGLDSAGLDALVNLTSGTVRMARDSAASLRGVDVPCALM